MSDTSKKRINKKIVAISGLLLLWPFALPLIILIPIYSLVGSSLSPEELDSRLAGAEMVMKTLFILAPISLAAGIALIIKKLWVRS